MSDSVIHASSGPGGVRYVPTRLFPEGPAQYVKAPAELGLTETDRSLNQLYEMAQFAAFQISQTDIDGKPDWSSIYPHDDRVIWESVAAISLSIGVTGRILLAAVSEIDGLISSAASEPRCPDAGLAFHRSFFLLEAAEQYALSIGHHMSSASFRLCNTDPICIQALSNVSKLRGILNKSAGDQNHRNAWPMHSAAMDAASALAKRRSGPARCMRATARLYKNSRWRKMEDLRNRWFHRCRPDFLVSNVNMFKVAQGQWQVLAKAIQFMAEPVSAFTEGLHIASPVTIKNSIRLFSYGEEFTLGLPSKDLK